MKNGAFRQIAPFSTQRKGASRKMVPFITNYCIVLIILVNAKGIICHVTPFNSK